VASADKRGFVKIDALIIDLAMVELQEIDLSPLADC
jgi:hypothetical protein